MVSARTNRTFTYTPIERASRPTVLHDAHLARTKPSRMAPFAGYTMPLWFSTIREEHQAVRQAAGLFDCTHMGVFGFAGDDAELFLNAVTSSNVSRLETGQAQYGYILDAEGQVLDDVIVYRRGPEDFFMVANAANKDKIHAYLTGLCQDAWSIDPADPDRGLDLNPTITFPAQSEAGQGPWVDIALQGPASAAILQRVLTGDAPDPAGLPSFRFFAGCINDIPCIVSRTGYTGAQIGFELLVGEDLAVDLWECLLQAGAHPCGLGARDSLRVEAGLPLYGHELAGPLAVNPVEAGYGWAIKQDKGFFVGQSARQTSPRAIQRLAFAGGRGVRPIRASDAVLNADGTCIGWLVSAAGIDDRQIGLALLVEGPLPEGTPLGLYYLARNAGQVARGRLEHVDAGQGVVSDIDGQILKRFERF